MLKGHPPTVMSATFNPDGALLASSSTEGWVAFSPDGLIAYPKALSEGSLTLGNGLFSHRLAWFEEMLRHAFTPASSKVPAL